MFYLNRQEQHTLVKLTGSIIDPHTRLSLILSEVYHNQEPINKP